MQSFQVGILFEMVEIVPAEGNGPLECAEGLFFFPHEGKTAGEIVIDNRVFGTQSGKALVYLERLFVEPLFRVGLGQGNQRVDEVGVLFDEALKK